MNHVDVIHGEGGIRSLREELVDRDATLTICPVTHGLSMIAFVTSGRFQISISVLRILPVAEEVRTAEREI